MNYFKEAEKILSHRSHLQKSLSNLERRKERLLHSGAPADISGLDTSKPYVSGGMVNNSMQDCLDLIEIQKSISETEIEIKEIDDVLHQLSSEDSELLSLWYIDGMPKEQICEELHLSMRHTAYERRNKAIGEFAVLYFGASALKSVF